MARATTKADLTASANGQFDKMWKLIDSMSEEQQKAADHNAPSRKFLLSHFTPPPFSIKREKEAPLI